MEFQKILNRFAEGIVAIDNETNVIRANRRTGEVYLPGAKTLTEVQLMQEIVTWWEQKYPEDFDPDSEITVEFPYPNLKRAACDLVFRSSDASNDDPIEWAIEVKHIALVGNNGKNNDYGVGKTLSPYLKDRSLIHDIARLTSDPIAPRRAVIMYGFEYSFATCDDANRIHPNSTEIVNEIRKVCRSVDPVAGSYTLTPLISFANEIFQRNGLVSTSARVANFEGAWRHPCGGSGTFAGWEVP